MVVPQKNKESAWQRGGRGEEGKRRGQKENLTKERDEKCVYV